MTASSDAFQKPLDHAHEHARQWLSSLPDRPVAPRAAAEELAGMFPTQLPEQGLDAVDVITALVWAYVFAGAAA